MTKRIKKFLTFVTLFVAFFALFSAAVFSVKATGNISLEVNDVALRTVSDASGKYGIRYTVTVNGYDSGAIYGMYIVPADLKDDQNEYREVFGEPTEKDGVYTFICSLTDILPSNTSRPFIAKAFARVNEQDVATSEWSDAKSIYTIATQALADKSYNKEGVSDYLTGVVNTVHGEGSNLQGKYVVESVKVGETAVEDVNALDFNKEFVISATVVKEGDNTKKLTAYPVVTVDNGKGDVTDGTLSQVDAYGKYKFVKNDICDFTLGFNLGDTVKTVEDCNLDSYNATFNQDGSISLSGMQVGSTLNTDWCDGHNLGYYALEGQYGVGTCVDIYFTDNNMPYVMFFADEINGNIGPNGGNGIILFNGVVQNDGILEPGKNTGYLRGGQLIAYGPNRMYSPDFKGYGDMDMYVPGINNDGETISANVLKMTQIGLRQSSNVNYKLTIRTYADSNGNLAFDILLGNADSGEIIHEVDMRARSTGDNHTFPVANLVPGNIIVYSSLKASSSSPDRFTTFKVSEPYESVVSGKTYSGDNFAGNKVMLTAGKNTNGVPGALRDDGWASDLKNYTNNYIAFDGGYTVGKYIDFTFTGNNMPIVTLFANEINGKINGTSTGTTTNVDLNGYLVTNIGGIHDAVSNPSGGEWFFTNMQYVFGPNRITTTLAGATSSQKITVTNGEYLSTLETGVDYKYIVGSKEVAGNVVIDIALYTVGESDDTLVYTAEYSTGKTISEVETLGDDVIVFAGIKGYYQDSENANNRFGYTTTFAYSEFYTKG